MKIILPTAQKSLRNLTNIQTHQEIPRFQAGIEVFWGVVRIFDQEIQFSKRIKEM